MILSISISSFKRPLFMSPTYFVNNRHTLKPNAKILFFTGSNPELC